MAEKLTTYAWKHSKRDQILVFMVTLLTFPTIWITLELPKMIINDAIGGEDFPREVFSYEFSQLNYLFLLCGAYLLAIGTNNGLKFFLNFTRGIMGERMLRRMRFDLFSKVMARKINRLRNTSPGEVVQMISAELAPIGDFVGAIFATPLLQGGSFLVFLGFIIVQNTYIGIAALSLYPVQAYLIPKLQARVVAMITRRLVNLRAIAREISESIDGGVEVRALRTRRWHLALVSDKLYENYLIRRRIFILKNLIKFTNNVADHLTPFLIFLIGGYFVIDGQLDVGALTAVLIAYKDLSSPWRDLLTYYQDFSDMSARFRSVMSQFQDDTPLAEDADVARHGEHSIALVNAQAEGFRYPVTCHVPIGSVTALVCENDALRGAVLQALGGILELEDGEWTVNETNPLRAPVLISTDTRVFTGTVRYNIEHGLYGYPVSDATDDQAATRRREANITGSTPDDILGGWISPEALGYADQNEIETCLMNHVRALDFEQDLYQIGLGSRIEPEERPELARKTVEMRKAVEEDPEFAKLRGEFVDVWDFDTYNPHGSVGENIFFARPKDRKLTWRQLADERTIAKALETAGVSQILVMIGVDICQTLLSLFEGVDDQSDLLSRYGMFPKAETPLIENIVSKATRRGPQRLVPSEKNRMIGIALEYGSARYRLRLLRAKDKDTLIVAARKRLRETGFTDARLCAFDPQEYVASFTLAENLFFGPVRLDRRDSWGPFADKIDALAARRDLREEIVRAGLEQQVGDGGVSLDALQRRKIAVARALLKRPGAIIFDGIYGSASKADVAFRELVRSRLGTGALVFGSDKAEAFPDAQHLIYLSEKPSEGLHEGPPKAADLGYDARAASES